MNEKQLFNITAERSHEADTDKEGPGYKEWYVLAKDLPTAHAAVAQRLEGTDWYIHDVSFPRGEFIEVQE